jgi:hypothetical protein
LILSFKGETVTEENFDTFSLSESEEDEELFLSRAVS